MNLLTILVLCSAIIYATGQGITKEKLTAIGNECKTSVGATDADVEAMMKHEPANGSAAECLRSCVMKKFEIMDENGKVLKDNAKNIIKMMANGDAARETAGAELIDACDDSIQSTDHCKAAVEYIKCLRDEVQKRGIEPFKLDL